MTQIVFIDSKYEGEIQLSKKALDYIKEKKINSLALFASVQFSKIGKILDQLKSVNIETRITKAKRTSTPLQILGCDCYNSSFKDNIIQEADAILYIGDGLFHPKALLLAQIKNKNIKQKKKKKKKKKKYIKEKKIGIFKKKTPGKKFFNSQKK